MGHVIALKLSLCLTLLPVISREIPKVDVNCFRDEGAGANGAIAGGKALVLSMALVKDDSMGCIECINSSNFEVQEECFLRVPDMQLCLHPTR